MRRIGVPQPTPGYLFSITPELQKQGLGRSSLSQTLPNKHNTQEKPSARLPGPCANPSLPNNIGASKLLSVNSLRTPPRPQSYPFMPTVFPTILTSNLNRVRNVSLPPPPPQLPRFFIPVPFIGLIRTLHLFNLWSLHSMQRILLNH